MPPFASVPEMLDSITDDVEFRRTVRESIEFREMIVAEFSDYARGTLTVQEMLLRPSVALHFCNTVRKNRGLWTVEDCDMLASLRAALD